MPYNTFISYRRKSCLHLAGRIYDYLTTHHVSTFLDIEEMTAHRFDEQIKQRIQEAKNFVLVLSPGDIYKKTDLKENEPDWFHEEITCANQNGLNFIIVQTENIQKEIDEIKNQGLLSAAIETLQRTNRQDVPKKHFVQFAEDVFQSLIPDDSDDPFAWKSDLMNENNIALMARDNMERKFASLQNRFGKDVIKAIKNPSEGAPFSSHVLQIRSACFAGTQFIFGREGKMDHQIARKGKGMLFQIIEKLLQEDDQFTFEMVCMNPDSAGAQDAAEYKKLGNRAYDNQKELFDDAYNGVKQLIAKHPAFKGAYETRRFQYCLTDETLPYAIMQVLYDDDWECLDHIKVDLYSEGIEANNERLTFCVFKEDHPTLYQFFNGRYNYILSRSYSLFNKKKTFEKETS